MRSLIREIVFSLLSQQFPIYHQTSFPPKPSAKVGFSRDLSMLLLRHPALPPTERYVPVGTFLELCFTRNNNFPGFPVIPKDPISCHTAFPPKPSTKVRFSRNSIARTPSPTPSPATDGEVRTSWNIFADKPSYIVRISSIRSKIFFFRFVRVFKTCCLNSIFLIWIQFACFTIPLIVGI